VIDGSIDMRARNRMWLGVFLLAAVLILGIGSEGPCDQI